MSTTPVVGPPSLVHTRAGRVMILGLAVMTMVVEMAALTLGVGLRVGSIPVSVSLVPALVLLAALGSRSVGRPGDRDRLVPFWVAMGAGLLLGLVLFAQRGHAVDVLALLVAATNEEVVYRFAVPVVVTTALLVLRVPTGPARFVGYLAAGVWWVLLPGHQAQMTSAFTVATYAAFAVISALVVARSRALLPMSVAHCILNVITIAHLRGDLTSNGRALLSACLLFLLVGTFAWPGDRTPARLRARREAPDEDLVTDAVIDLRDGHRPSVRHGHAVQWVDRDPAGEPAPTEEDRAVSHQRPHHTAPGEPTVATARADEPGR